ncbi:hypothetical protein [Falsiroseomonas sp.]|uniref:hypothetical protein n=1 Tax=Falsiroseomonas sp. TaxID=2870721 RepID=UPI003F6EB9B2
MIRSNRQRVATGTTRYSGELRAMMVPTKKLRIRKVKAKLAAIHACPAVGAPAEGSRLNDRRPWELDPREGRSAF